MSRFKAGVVLGILGVGGWMEMKTYIFNLCTIQRTSFHNILFTILILPPPSPTPPSIHHLMPHPHLQIPIPQPDDSVLPIPRSNHLRHDQYYESHRHKRDDKIDDVGYRVYDVEGVGDGVGGHFCSLLARCAVCGTFVPAIEAGQGRGEW